MNQVIVGVPTAPFTDERAELLRRALHRHHGDYRVTLLVGHRLIELPRAFSIEPRPQALSAITAALGHGAFVLMVE